MCACVFVVVVVSIIFTRSFSYRIILTCCLGQDKAYAHLPSENEKNVKLNFDLKLSPDTLLWKTTVKEELCVLNVMFFDRLEFTPHIGSLIPIIINNIYIYEMD